MGYCFSCCRRRKPKDDEERQRLLVPTDPLKPPRSLLERSADVLAALHAGKLPTQQQIDLALRHVQQSSILDADNVVGASDPLGGEVQKVMDDVRNVADALLQVGMEKNYDDKIQDTWYNIQLLSNPVRVTVPGDIRVDAPTNSIETAAAAIPSQDELAADTVALISSLRDILFLVLTSSAFRLLVSDLLGTFREIVAFSAEKVKLAATTVKNVAETVEIDMRTAGTVEQNIQVPRGPVTEPVSVKDTLLGRFEDILRQAQSTPSHNAAVRTLLYLLRKYAARVNVMAEAVSQTASAAREGVDIDVSLPIIIPDPLFTRAIEDLKVVIERFAGGQSLEPLLAAFSDLVSSISTAAENGASSEAQFYLNQVGAWLDKALTDPSFASSRLGRESASQLFDEGQDLLANDSDFSRNSDRLLDEANRVFEALVTDGYTRKLFVALDKLQKDFISLVQQVGQRGRSAASNWQFTALRLLLTWILPRLLRIIHVIPMPRVEYIQRQGELTKLAVALDALLLSADEALLPDVLQVQEWAEVRVDFDERLGAAELTNPNRRLTAAGREATTGNGRTLDAPTETTALLASMLDEIENRPASYGDDRRTRTHSTSRVQIHIEGLRLGVHDVGYYASYNLSEWLGYTDEGLVSAAIGRSGRRGEGLSLDIELELDSDAYDDKVGSRTTAQETEQKPLYRVVNVSTSVPGLTLRLAHTRHWMLNALLAPLAGAAGRFVAPIILNSQIRNALEKLEELLRDVKKDAEEKADERQREREVGDESTEFGDWWNAFLRRFSKDKSGEEIEESDEAEDEVYSESYTSANLKGIVRTTVQQPQSPSDADAPPLAESAVAVGIGAQLLPGRAKPTEVHRAAPSDVARDAVRQARTAVNELEDGLEHVDETAREVEEQGIRKAVKARHAIEDAGERIEARETVERRKRGWKSRAFDFS